MAGRRGNGGKGFAMKLLFVVDGRSPIALNWIRYFVNAGEEVHIASMYPCAPKMAFASLTILPVVFSGAVKSETGETKANSIKARFLRLAATPAVRTWLRHQFVPRSLPKAADALQTLVARIQPDLIHAMRVPYEGMLAAIAASRTALPAPLLISIWGNDFTLHAPATRTLTRLTRLTMQHADALHTDCYRDQHLAHEWGFAPSKPAIVLPGGGGIQMEIFKPLSDPAPSAEAEHPIVINPRGMRAYVRSDTFFQAIPRVLAARPKTRFVCPNMAGQPEAERWVRELHIGQAVELLPRQSRPRMAELFRRAQVVVSPARTTARRTPCSKRWPAAACR
jgi:hypothetical protein